MKIEHGKAAYQGNLPICGIYAFINGLLYNSKLFNQDIVDKIALDIWQIIIQNRQFKNLVNKSPKKLDINCETLNKPKIYSAVGEFYSSKNFIDFLEYNHNKIKNIFGHYKLTNIDYEIDKKFNNPIVFNNDPNTFYMVPINSFSCLNLSNKNNMHWICLKQKAGKLIILNSEEKCRTEMRAMWKAERKYKKITKSNELMAVYDNMCDRKECPFNFKCWSLLVGVPNLYSDKCKKLLNKGYKDKYFNVLCDIIKTNCHYEFEQGDLSAIKIDIINNNNLIVNDSSKIKY